MRTKKTPQIKRIVAALEQLKKLSLVKIKKKLRQRGYKCVNRNGGYKLVFRRKKEPVCVKVYRTEDGWKDDSYIVPNMLKKHFLYPVFKCKKFLVQEWVDELLDLDDRPEKKSLRIPDDIWGHKDVREDNVGIKNGKEVILDFVT